MEAKESKGKVEKIKGVRVVVVRKNLKYRIKGINKGESFIPKIGEKILLPKDVLKKELDTGNVRLLLKEEKGKVVLQKKKKLEKK